MVYTQKALMRVIGQTNRFATEFRALLGATLMAGATAGPNSGNASMLRREKHRVVLLSGSGEAEKWFYGVNI